MYIILGLELTSIGKRSGACSFGECRPISHGPSDGRRKQSIYSSRFILGVTWLSVDLSSIIYKTLLRCTALLAFNCNGIIAPLISPFRARPYSTSQDISTRCIQSFDLPPLAMLRQLHLYEFTRTRICCSSVPLFHVS